MRPNRRIYLGCVSPIPSRIESPKEIRDRRPEAMDLPSEQSGATEAWGFSRFSDDLYTNRDTAFSRILSYIERTQLAAVAMGGS